jgi:1-acyl-sn-glycerol-3-phosphate acyltransferase
MKVIKKVIFIKRIKTDIEGFENLPNKPTLIIANHKSNFDPVILFKALYAQRNNSEQQFDFIFVAKKEMNKKFSVLTPALDLLDTVYIDRSDIRQQFKAYEAQNKLVKDRKKSIIIFIEGTRHYGDEFGEFKSGALRIGYENFMPILPVVIYGSSGVMDYNKTNKNKNRIVVAKALTPLNAHNYHTHNSQWLADELKREMQDKYNAIKEQLKNKRI